MDRRKKQENQCIMKVEDHILLNGYKHVLYQRAAISQEESRVKSAQYYE